MYDYRARLVRLIDADTFVLDIDLGFYVHTEQHIRLLGIDCPEGRTPEGRRATEFTRSWWAARGDEAVVVTAKRPTRSLERFVAQVLTAEQIVPSPPFDKNLDACLRLAGHFKPVEHLG